MNREEEFFYVTGHFHTETPLLYYQWINGDIKDDDLETTVVEYIEYRNKSREKMMKKIRDLKRRLATLLKLRQKDRYMIYGISDTNTEYRLRFDKETNTPIVYEISPDTAKTISIEESPFTQKHIDTLRNFIEEDNREVDDLRKELDRENREAYKKLKPFFIQSGDRS